MGSSLTEATILTREESWCTVHIAYERSITFYLTGIPVLLTTNNMNVQTGSIKKQFFVVDFYTHYKRIGPVIIPKPHYSSREGINSHCRCFGWLIFAVFAQSVAAKYYRSGCCGSDVAGHSTVTALLPVPLVHSTVICPRVVIRDSLNMFFADKKC